MTDTPDNPFDFRDLLSYNTLNSDAEAEALRVNLRRVYDFIDNHDRYGNPLAGLGASDATVARLVNTLRGLCEAAEADLLLYETAKAGGSIN